MIGREQIASVMRQLNEAENSRPHTSVEETSRRIDAVMSPHVHGWRNGAVVPNRQAEREAEHIGFARCPDYHRDFDRMLVEPPFATIGWTIRGTIDGRKFATPGCSIFEFGDDGLVHRYWLYADLTPFTPAR